MTQSPKAMDSGLCWFRLNLTKRKELAAFRNTVIEKINDINKGIVNLEDDSDDNVLQSRHYIFPSNDNNIDGYYDSIMSNIKFSCWVKCTEEELLDILGKLNAHNVVADASRKSNSGVIRVMDENEINTLKWIINTTPANLYRANCIPKDAIPARLPVQGGVIIDGHLTKMRGKVETDKFFFNVLDNTLFVVINKGTAEEVVDLSQEIENAKKANISNKTNNERHWMVLRVSRGQELTLEEKIVNWKEDVKEELSEGFQFETFLPTYMKEIKRNDRIIGQRKSLLCPGYIFIHTSIIELLFLETHKSWDGSFISRLLVRQSMRKDGYSSKALIISEREMNDFKFAVNSNLTNIELESDDYVDNELVKYYKPGDPFNQKIGRILHKGNDLYLTFLPIGGMKVTNGFRIESSQIRKLTSKEKAELKP